MILVEKDKIISEEIDCCENLSVLFFSIEEILILNAVKFQKNKMT